MAKISIQNGQFQSAKGTALAGATLVLKLSNDAVVTGTGQVVSNLPLSITLDASGNAPATAIWPNDQMSPSGTVYVATLFDVSGAPAWTGSQNWSITGSSTIELNTLVPSANTVSYSGSVLLNPSGPQSISTYGLTVTTLTVSGTTTLTGSLSIKDGASGLVLQNASSATKTAIFDLSNITAANQRTVNVPDANSTTAQVKNSTAHQYLTAMSSQGVFSAAQPAVADLSDGSTGTGAVVLAVSPTLTGTLTASLISNKRIAAHAGTALIAGDFAASSGWGTSPVISVIQGTDQAGSVTIQAKATTGANPTLTLTFHDGTWTQVPVVVCSRTDTVAATGSPSTTVTNQWHVTSVTATTAVFTFVGQPVANSTYGLTFITMGT